MLGALLGGYAEDDIWLWIGYSMELFFAVILEW